MLSTAKPLPEGRTSAMEATAAPLQPGLEMGEKVSRSSPKSSSQVLADPEPEPEPEVVPGWCSCCCGAAPALAAAASAARRISSLYCGAEEDEDEEEQAEGLQALLPLLLLVRFE